MDLDSAFRKHGGWIEEFCTAIFNQDTLDVAVYQNDNHCELGKWLYGEGKIKYGEFNAYADLVASHAAFHKVAGSIVQAINAKNYKLAEELLGENSQYATASQKVHAAILNLKKNASHHISS